MIAIRKMRTEEATAVARMHAATITGGFLNKLGIRFLAGLYRGILEDGASQIWVADRDGEIIGFCAYAQNVGAMYRNVLRRRFLRLAWASLPRSLNPVTGPISPEASLPAGPSPKAGDPEDGRAAARAPVVVDQASIVISEATESYLLGEEAYRSGDFEAARRDVLLY